MFVCGNVKLARGTELMFGGTYVGTPSNEGMDWGVVETFFKLWEVNRDWFVVDVKSFASSLHFGAAKSRGFPDKLPPRDKLLMAFFATWTLSTYFPSLSKVLCCLAVGNDFFDTLFSRSIAVDCFISDGFSGFLKLGKVSCTVGFATSTGSSSYFSVLTFNRRTNL